MRAAFLTGPRTLELRETDLPAAGDDQVLVRVVGCGICGSDLHGWTHPELTIVAGDGPVPGFSGHEIVAEPIDAPGSLVALEPNRLTACGECATCVVGAAWFCRTRTPTPSFGFAEQLVVPVSSMFRIPASVRPVTATLVEPLACAVHTVRASSTARSAGRIDGAKVAVLGSGVTGLLTIAAATRLGASEVVATARHPHQADAARRMGAAEVLVPGGEDTEKKLRAFRPEFVVEAVGGKADTLSLAMKVAAPRGEVAVFGLFDEPQSVNLRRATYKELRLFFPVTYSVTDGVHDFEVAIDILADSGLDFDPLISHTFPLDEVDEAFRTAANKRSGALRVVVTP
jgi:2-desacetyl-2-hydroxyethyl bacteriochlorophyllide A dehydrogenase